MKYSIFHTSQCGSTLLATLLKNSIKTYSEPKWATHPHTVLKTKSLYHEDNTLIKYPSYTSFISNMIPDKKVFIFRDLQDHLEKITSKERAMNRHLSYHYKIYRERNIFPDIETKTDLQKLAFIWAHTIFDINNSQNVLFLNANDLFLYPRETVNKVTKFFNIDPVEDLDPLSFYVKKDFLSQNESLDKIIPSEKIPYNIKDGYIKSTKYSEIKEWCYLLFDPKKLEIQYLPQPS